MKENVNPVIAGRIQSPKGMLDAEARISKREVLRRRIEGEPNPAYTIWCSQQFIIGDVGIIVPEEAATPRRPVNQDRDGREQQKQKINTPPPNERPLRNSVPHWVLENS